MLVYPLWHCLWNGFRRLQLRSHLFLHRPVSCSALLCCEVTVLEWQCPWKRSSVVNITVDVRDYGNEWEGEGASGESWCEWSALGVDCGMAEQVTFWLLSCDLLLPSYSWCLLLSRNTNPPCTKACGLGCSIARVFWDLLKISTTWALIAQLSDAFRCGVSVACWNSVPLSIT